MDHIIETCNVNGIADPTKRRAVFEFLYTVQDEVILIHETHGKVATKPRKREQAFFNPT